MSPRPWRLPRQEFRRGYYQGPTPGRESLFGKLTHHVATALPASQHSHCAYLAALARMDAVVEARRLVPAHAALHVEAAARGPVTACLQLVQQRGWGGAPGEVCRHTTRALHLLLPEPEFLTHTALARPFKSCVPRGPTFLRPVSLYGTWG